MPGGTRGREDPKAPNTRIPGSHSKVPHRSTAIAHRVCLEPVAGLRAVPARDPLRELSRPNTPPVNDDATLSNP